MAREVILKQANAREMMTVLKNVIIEGLQSGDLAVLVRRPSKSREQEKKYHAMIREIAGQVRTYGKRWGDDVWKALLVDQFAQDRANIGEPLRKPGSVVPAMDGSGRMVTVRPSTAGFSKQEGSDFIEFLYATGIELGVQWSASAEQIAAAECDIEAIKQQRAA